MNSTVHEAEVLGNVEKGLLIGGQFRPATGGRTFPVENPATGTTLCEVADGTSRDALEALDAACAAQASWAATAPRERSEILRRAYDLLVARTEEIAQLITLEMGKSLAESRSEVVYGAEFFRWYSEEAVRIQGDFTVEPGGSGRIMLMRQPVGPSLLITPWNVPLAMPTRKIGPAIAAGCTMILKPAEQTPLTALLLASVLTEAGLPDGVLNVITTSEPEAVAAPLVHDGRLRKVSFTGSTEVGRKLIVSSADKVLRTSMELGGNAPFIVCADADVDAAVDGAMIAKMRNIGEACIAANRFYVHADVAEEFTEKLSARMGKMVVGRGDEDGAEVGPLIDAAQRDRVAELVDDAVRRGARVRTGGTAPPGPGYFYPPTVLTDVSPAARLRTEEIFGPVAAISTFADEQEVLRSANDTESGLVSYVYSRDIGRALRLAEGLETGMVGLNRGFVSNPAAPFGGMKQSGLGREGGRVGIEEFLEIKYVAVEVD
ncbi:NAD-dependent succinate-semialdehyde dehydrogenase [Lentzea albidocapillata]|uniref:Succinate-semialdehyde dehydrogenase / glutarate-semialdehyde dehydrogenase n=1 Tax=Lentzea albidocapillata TaxID=40571 RepID=A0A1W2DG19_9PSEU|nr:NAD-dependent succinate-semialdehyde dehydrogenase [Lentzea albidocapillata]SMC96395.1 succinate-semialdehyde dehydrogenase / glutarate-semialdehyde dehydrogenase [Lentzea albidocapillata]